MKISVVLKRYYFEHGQKQAKEIYYMGSGGAVGMMFGAVGGIVIAATSRKPGQVLDKFAIDNGIC